MRAVLSNRLESGRVLNGQWTSPPGSGPHGAFSVAGPCATDLTIIACDGKDDEAQGWEHVSVSCRNRCPNWLEMNFVKGLFWRDDETVIQFHPAKSEYVNQHPYCLHLWKPVDQDIALPPGILVGLK